MRAFLPSLLLSLLFACSGGSGNKNNNDAGTDAEVDALPPNAPVFFNPRDDLSDDELADQAVALLGITGAGEHACQDCHGMTRQQLFQWRALVDDSLANCFIEIEAPTQAQAKQMIDCMRTTPGDQDTDYHAAAISVFASGAHLPWFQYTFQRAYGSESDAEYQDFIDRVSMPRGKEVVPFTQEEFDIVASWFVRGIPLADEKLPPDPAPTECTPGVSQALKSHIDGLATTGWTAINKQNKLLMHGCGKGDEAVDCLDEYPESEELQVSQGWAVGVPGQKLRVLRENGYRSNFWTRSSADGRFVANGATTAPAGFDSVIVDLARDVGIPTNALYDPGFFPDNSGFMFQRNNAAICNQSLLVTEPESIDFNQEEDCTITGQVGLYQHVGASLDGGDYWSVDGQFVSDNGGKDAGSRDPKASFSQGSRASLVPIIHDGANYSAQDNIRVPTPYEGDAVLSPSSTLLVSRLRGPNDRQLGFVMRQVIATPSFDTYEVELPEVARYCINGGKPGFSYDERWLTIHHYVENSDAEELGFTGIDDPGFQDYRELGASNIYLLDAKTGAHVRITNMKPGQYALFPHFRSDGWLYFIVRTLGSPTEFIVASDAALLLEGL